MEGIYHQMENEHSYIVFEIVDKPCSMEYGPLQFITYKIAEICKSKNINIKNDRIVHILEIRTENEEDMGKGYATSLLNEFIEKFKDDVIITRSKAFKADYPEMPTDEEFTDCLYKQDVFFTLRGFLDFNNICNLECGIPYIFINDTSKPIIKEILRHKKFLNEK